jgi:hypothetical protein
MDEIYPRRGSRFGAAAVVLGAVQLLPALALTLPTDPLSAQTAAPARGVSR